MKKYYIISLAFLILFVGVIAQYKVKEYLEETEEERYENPRERAKWEYERMADPATGKVPPDGKYKASLYTYQKQQELYSTMKNAAWGPWIERGPNADLIGPSNGNIRQNASTGPGTSGRMRTVLVDANDGTGNTVWTAGVAGGVWKTTNFNTASPTWTNVSDFYTNLAVTSIAQDPSNFNTLYFCTGEGFFNLDAVQGAGVWKSTDGGNTWTQLASTAGFAYCSKVVVDAAGNVYVGVNTGLRRSTDGGVTWTNINPTGVSAHCTDLEISSTGTLHATFGLFATCAYRYTNSPATVAAGTWTSAATNAPASNERIEIGCKGNTLYALNGDGAGNLANIKRSTDGGANWTTVTTPAGVTSGQAWYCLAVDINPSDPNDVFIGSLDGFISTNGGTSWTQVSEWVTAPAGDYVHADHQYALWRDANNIYVATDGGIFHSTNAGTSFISKNDGLRIKQFYACAIHPTSTNYFLAGAQDNGSHQFTAAGLGATTEVMGGDGCFVHIDQDQPTYQWVSYVYNNYRTSTNGGATWTSQNIANTGQFINPTDYDDVNNIMYCADAAQSYRRWTNPQSGGAATSAVINITNMSGSVTAVKVASPFTNNRVYFGTNNAQVIYVNNAHSIASGSTGTVISSGFPAGSDVSCIEFGTTENNIVVTFSNYGINNVWVTTNGGATWTAVDGTLPNMPVRWAMFYPGDDTRLIIATEAGVYATPLINGASTNWYPSVSYPVCATYMLQYRSLDQTIAAATHGRGLWTNNVEYVLPFNGPKLTAIWTDKTTAELKWHLENPRANVVYEIELAPDNINFQKVGEIRYDGKSDYTFTHQPSLSKTLYYRIREKDKDGASRLSNIATLNVNQNDFNLQIANIFPNPVKDKCYIDIESPKSGDLMVEIYTLNGQKVQQHVFTIPQIGKHRFTIDMTNLSTGAYYLVARSGTVVDTQKIIKW
jgi:photosystem II stability/assembly factor-like uncharacterized protein